MTSPLVSRPLETRTKVSHENSLRMISFWNEGQKPKHAASVNNC